MRNKRMRAFWMTLLFYALAGPLVGLLLILVTGILIDAWGPIADRVGLLLSHPQSASCGPPYSGHFDLGCFQRRPDPRQFTLFGSDTHILSGILVAYVVGFLPALLTG